MSAKVEADRLLEGGRTPEDVARMQAALVPGSLVSDHAALFKAVVERLSVNIEEYSEHYGSFLGGDPRDFRPSPEDSTLEELEAHRLACVAADAGPEGRHLMSMSDYLSRETGALVQAQEFGLGTTTFRDPEGEEILKTLRAFIGVAS